MPPQSLLDLLNSPLPADVPPSGRLPPPEENWTQDSDSHWGPFFEYPAPQAAAFEQNKNVGVQDNTIFQGSDFLYLPHVQDKNITASGVALPLGPPSGTASSIPPISDTSLRTNNLNRGQITTTQNAAQTSLRDISNAAELPDNSLLEGLYTLPRSSTPIVPAQTWSTTPLSTFGDGLSDAGLLSRDREPGSHAARHPERQVNQPRNQKKKPKKSAGEDGDRDLMGRLSGSSDSSKIKDRLQSLRDSVEDELVTIASDFKQDLAKLRTQLMTGFIKPKGTSRTPSLYNAKMKEASKDVEIQDQLDQLGLTGRDRQSWMQQHVRRELSNITTKEEQELKDACLKDRETASIGVRVNYKATCADYTKNVERISTEVNTLHFRTGAAFFGIAAKAHKTDNGRPQLITTPDLDDFIIEETGKTAAEFAHAMQFYVFQSADRHRKALTMPQLVQKMSKWMLSSMASLTQQQIPMVYADEEKIPADYGIKLVGWPSNITFKSPSSMNKSELLLLSEAADSGSMRWIRLSNNEQEGIRAHRASRKLAKNKPSQKRARKADADSTDDSDNASGDGGANKSRPTSDARKRQKKTSSSRSEAASNRSEQARRPQQSRRQKAATSAEMVVDSDAGEDEASVAVGRGRTDGDDMEHSTGRGVDVTGMAGTSSGVAHSGVENLMPVRHNIGAPTARRIPTTGDENDGAMSCDG